MPRIQELRLRGKLNYVRRNGSPPRANRTSGDAPGFGGAGKKREEDDLFNLGFMFINRFRSKLSRVAAWVFATMLLVVANAPPTWIGLFGRVVCRLPPLPDSRPQIAPSLPRNTHRVFVRPQ